MDVTSEPKISLIVAVYKVEPYIRKCLDSIAAQTHRNLEVILVDDGSPDNCPAICDEYAAKDPRFKVIHKENGGIASGYNAGLDACTGDWIGFVDPDDWVEPDMFEYLLAGARRHNVKMAACSFCHTDGHDEKVYAFEKECVISGKQAIEMLLKRTLPMVYGPWQRLCTRELWDGVRFKEAAGAQDVLGSCASLMQTQSLVCLPEVKYYWRLRLESGSSGRSLHDMMASYQTQEELYDRILTQEPELQMAAVNSVAISAWWVWCFYDTAPREERREALPKMREISAFCRPHIKWLAKNGTFGKTGRIGCRLLAWPAGWSFALARALWKIYEWKHGVKHGVAL